MIKQIKTIQEMTKILVTNDKLLEKTIPCSKGEWVQWLCQEIENPRIVVFADFENGKINAYVVILNNVMPPVFDAVSVLYLWSPSNHKTTRALIERSKEFAIKIGAIRGVISVPTDHTDKYIETFGGTKIANVFEWRAI